MYAANIFHQGDQCLVAACDEDLLGQTWNEGKLRLETASNFYDGGRVDRGELQAALQKCTVANLVGEGAVAVAREMGLIDGDNVMRVDGIPHAQYMVLA